jgi:hypothetical protein
MSYATLIARVGDEPAKEIVDERVLIRAYAETRQDKIALHISPPIMIGPAQHSAHDVHVAIFDEKRGGEVTAKFYCAPHIVVGDYVNMGGSK